MTLSCAASELIAGLWRDFATTTPHAERIRELLVARGEAVHHDHVAIRTIGAPGLGLESLARRFEAVGFEPRERYRFEEAGLRARYWQHEDPNAPKLFIAELEPSSLSPGAQVVLERLIAQAPPDHGGRPDLLWAGRPWTPAYADYKALLAESEHAARIAALGIGVERFSLDVGALITFPDLDGIAAFLTEHAFRIDMRTERAVIRPESITVRFSDAVVRIPSGTYELAARRWPRDARPRISGLYPVSVAK